MNKHTGNDYIENLSPEGKIENWKRQLAFWKSVKKYATNLYNLATAGRQVEKYERYLEVAQ